MKLLVNERKIMMKEKYSWAQTTTGIIWACFVFVLSSHCCHCQCLVGDIFGDMLIVGVCKWHHFFVWVHKHDQMVCVQPKVYKPSLLLVIPWACPHFNCNYIQFEKPQPTMYTNQGNCNHKKVQTAVQSGSTFFFQFNEPDLQMLSLVPINLFKCCQNTLVKSTSQSLMMDFGNPWCL